MKKILFLTSIALSTFIFTGCGGGGDPYYPPDNATTLFLVNQDGFSYAGIPYLCDGMTNWSKTLVNGEFTFYPGENCTFDFLGLQGNYNNDPLSDEIIQIVDINNVGKKDIHYTCDSYGPDITGFFGEFFYDMNDRCTFEL